MAKPDLKRNVLVYHTNSNREDRYASYDFCYSYFQLNKGNLAKDMQKSCSILWGYLASWGMLRGSSELLQKSPAALEKLIEHFDDIAQDTIWTIDVPDYPAKEQPILDEYKAVRDILAAIITHPSVTLVTKIMLGTYGVIPAFDRYFTSVFRQEYAQGYNKPQVGPVYCKFTKVDSDAIKCIHHFYKDNQADLDSIKLPVIDFSGKTTKYIYKIAKLIDMYGFSKGVLGK